MHLIVRIADVAASTLVQWESTHFEGNPPVQSMVSGKSESGIVRLIRTTCKALSKHGNEQCNHLHLICLQKGSIGHFQG